jgi:hypothetical protein
MWDAAIQALAKRVKKRCKSHEALEGAGWSGRQDFSRASALVSFPKFATLIK